VKQILPLMDGDGADTVTGLDVCSSFLLVTTVFNILYLYDLSRRSVDLLFTATLNILRIFIHHSSLDRW